MPSPNDFDRDSWEDWADGESDTDDVDPSPRDNLVRHIDDAAHWLDDAGSEGEARCAKYALDRANWALEVFDVAIEYLAPITARETDDDRLRRAGGLDFSDWHPWVSERLPGRCDCGHPVAAGVERCGGCVARGLWGGAR
jgi:hypothetical protein